MSQGRLPYSQVDVQKVVIFPLPNVMRVVAVKSCLSSSLQGVSMPLQGLLWGLHSYQSHRNLSALEKRSRSKTPRLPRTLGLQMRS